MTDESSYPPDFLILGAQKCGTTSLAVALGTHPEIFVPEGKEASHFGMVDDAELGGAEYQAFFSAWAGQPVKGEATPQYLFLPECAEQICRYLPKVKAIVILRHPVDRAYSAYWHGVRVGRLRGSFGENVLEEFQGVVKEGGFGDLVARGCYAEQLQRYFDLGFDSDRMLVDLFEDLVSDPADVLWRVQEFLGVSPIPLDLPLLNEAMGSYLPRSVRSMLFPYWRTRAAKLLGQITSKAIETPSMDPEIRSLLVEHYRPWNERLSALLDRDLSMWNL